MILEDEIEMLVSQLSRDLSCGGRYVDENDNIISDSDVDTWDPCSHLPDIRYQCTACRENICSDCLGYRHGNCSCIIEPSYLRRLTDMTLMNNQRRLERLAKRVEEEEMTFTREVTKVRRQVLERWEKLKSSIDAEKEALLRQISSVERVKVETWRTRREQCRDMLKGLCKWQESDKTSLQDINKLSSVVMRAEILDTGDEGFVHFEAANCQEMSMGSLQIPPSAKNSTVEVQDRVYVNAANSCIVTVRNALDETVTGDANYNLSVSLLDENYDPVNIIVENLQNGKFKVTFLPSQKGHHILSVAVNSVPIRDSPKQIQVLEPRATHQPAHVFGESGGGDGQFCRAWGVCCDARGRILVADRCNHRIQVFTSKGKFIRKFGKEGAGPGEFNRPAGIAVDKYCRIVVADKDNHRVQIFDSDGRYITHFGKCDSADDCLVYPWDVAVTDACNIAVTESKQRRVRLFTDSGVELLRFEFTAQMGLDCPRGISCTPDGSFLVTDFNKHKVVMLDGKFQNPKVLGSQGRDLMEFFRPQSVAVGPSGMFAVSDCKNHRIQIFKGHEVTVLGRHGTELGELDAPQGIAFHPNGSLVVVDFGNNRVQVFSSL